MEVEREIGVDGRCCPTIRLVYATAALSMMTQLNVTLTEETHLGSRNEHWPETYKIPFVWSG